MILEAAMGEGFKLTLNELFQFLKKKSSAFAKLKGIDIENAYLKASKVEEVKTIWQVDKVVNLNEFYYPSKIDVESNRVEINSLNDFPENGKIVVQGTAGQGKSILLRYLTGAELRHGKSIPIFVELRKITDRNNIETLIINSLSNLGVECDSSSLKHIYESNKCTLVLDAFDEVKKDLVQDVISYIEDLCSRFHNMKIVISSRPNSDIQCVTFFKVFNLCPLIPSDFPGILEKFFHNDESIKADDIVKAIHSNKSGIADLITTPLLLTLLTITYKSYHRIPERLHEFYDNLFYLLVNRHDSTKPGFVREFKSDLNENQLEELFCAFCFYCMIDKKDTLTHGSAISLIKKAKSIVGLENISEGDFLDDTKNNTCLIVEEGFEYNFIHKSIKEYHAASFISKSPLTLKEKFYNLAKNDPRQFTQEITYLENIDSYYCDTLFLIPIYEKLFSSFKYENTSTGVTDDIFNGITIGIQDGDLRSITWGAKCFSDNIYFNFYISLITALRLGTIKEEYATGNFELDIIDAYKEGFKDTLIDRIEQFLDSKNKEYTEIKDRIKKQELAINEINFT